MGKTCVISALVLANPAPPPTPKEPDRKKLTIYVVNNTLVQQVDAACAHSRTPPRISPVPFAKRPEQPRSRRHRAVRAHQPTTCRSPCPQVADEFRKFSPHLTIVMYYGSKQNKREANRDMASVDVLITVGAAGFGPTPSAEWPTHGGRPVACLGRLRAWAGCVPRLTAWAAWRRACAPVR